MSGGDAFSIETAPFTTVTTVTTNNVCEGEEVNSPGTMEGGDPVTSGALVPDPGSDGGAEATSKATPARARPSKDERVAAIRDLMARLEWKPGQTGPELARLWRVSPHTVVRDAAEAWRQLRDTGDVEAAKADFASRTEQWAEEARQSGDYIAASRLFELHGRATGALGSTSTPSFSQILAAEVETGHGPIKVSAALELLEVLIELALQSKDQAQRDGVRVAIRRVHGLPIDIEVEPT